MPPTKNKFPLRSPVVVDVGCGCRRPKLPSFFSSASPKPAPPLSPCSSSSSPFESTSESPITKASSGTGTSSSSSSRHSQQGKKKKEEKKEKNGGRVSESVAVVKESQDPYLDFRDSMLLMIVEKEIYALEDLKDLLHRFLSLNAPHHHPLILRAFAEIWHGVFAPPSPSPASPKRSRSSCRRRPLDT